MLLAVFTAQDSDGETLGEPPGEPLSASVEPRPPQGSHGTRGRRAAPLERFGTVGSDDPDHYRSSMVIARYRKLTTRREGPMTRSEHHHPSGLVEARWPGPEGSGELGILTCRSAPTSPGNAKCRRQGRSRALTMSALPTLFCCTM